MGDNIGQLEALRKIARYYILSCGFAIAVETGIMLV